MIQPPKLFNGLLPREMFAYFSFKHAFKSKIYSIDCDQYAAALKMKLMKKVSLVWGFSPNSSY